VTSLPVGPRRTSVPALAALAGAVWGLAGYALLWGYTPIVIQRPFVVSALGTALLLPVRIVLGMIRLVEDHLAGAPFDFSRNHGWIGALAGLVGASLVGLAAVAFRAAHRATSARRAGTDPPR
jgi:hypothetical protein